MGQEGTNFMPFQVLFPQIPYISFHMQIKGINYLNSYFLKHFLTLTSHFDSPFWFLNIVPGVYLKV